MNNLYLNIVVFISGAAVLAVEILGTRILGPFYGVNLYLWSALITVTLAALSVGYVVGGRWADKRASIYLLSCIVACAGIWLLLVPLLKLPILQVAEPMGLRLAVILAAFFLFAPPLTLLGMVGPFAIKLKTSSIKNVGQTAGDIYAISTVASVLSALMTGFILIPNIGLGRLTSSIGVTLILLALYGISLKIKSKLTIYFTILCIAVISVVSWIIIKPVPDKHKELLTVEQSAYAEIRVADIGGYRHMFIDGAIHTMVDPRNWNAVLRYNPVMDLNKLLFDKPGKLLVVGLGGGSLVKSFYNDGWQVDAVEIDPVVTKLAFEYFGLLPQEGNFYQMDGRRFLMDVRKKYDLIILDAYGSGYIPFQLVTKESFGIIKSRLSANGVLAVNVISMGWDDELINSLALTIKNYFKNIVIFPTSEGSKNLTNLVLIASNRKVNINTEEIDDPKLYARDIYHYNAYKYWYYSIQEYALLNKFTPDYSGRGVVFTDDLNPVDIMAEKVNYLGREGLHSYFKNKGLDW